MVVKPSNSYFVLPRWVLCSQWLHHGGMQSGPGCLHRGSADQLRRSPFLATSPYPSAPEVPAADRTTV